MFRIYFLFHIYARGYVRLLLLRGHVVLWSSVSLLTAGTSNWGTSLLWDKFGRGQDIRGHVCEGQV